MADFGLREALTGDADMKKRTYTKRAFLWLIFPYLYNMAMVFGGLLLSIMAAFLKDSGIESWVVAPLAIIVVLLFVFLPLIALVCVIVSVVCQIKALRSGETKWKNYVMMAVSVLHFIVVTRPFVQGILQLCCRG